MITFKEREHANLYIKCKWISWSDTCNSFLYSLNWLLSGASSNFDFIGIIIFCHDIYHKSPFTLFNYLFLCFSNINDWQIMISCTFSEVQECQSGYQCIVIYIFIFEVGKRFCRNIHVNFSLSWNLKNQRPQLQRNTWK